MSRLYDFSSCKSRGKSESFEQYLSSKIGVLPSEIASALAALNLDRLPWSWWPSAADAAARAIAKGGLKELALRFRDVCWGLDEFDAVGLYMGASAGQVNRAHIIHQPFDLSRQEFARYLAQLIERMAQDLLIHRLPGNEKISKLGRKMMEIRQGFLVENLSRSKPMSLKSAARSLYQSDAAECADFQHRLREAAAFAQQDLGYVGRRIYITAPAYFSPGPHRGDIDPRWIAAGKPDPAAAYAWLYGVLRAAHKTASRRGIVPIGGRVTESQNSSVPHLNPPLYFADDREAEEFEQILRNTYQRALSADLRRLGIAHTPAFSLDRQAIVVKVIDGAADAEQAAGYAAKFVKPYDPTKNTKGEPIREGDEPQGLDRLYCELWNITQFTEWGTGKKIGAWKTVKRLNGLVVQAHGQAGNVPDSLVVAWEAASGAMAERSYRTWLRLTHPLTPARLRRPVWTDQIVQGGRLFILSGDSGNHTITFDKHPCVVVCAPSSTRWFDGWGQLSITNPTQTKPTTPAPSDRTPRPPARRRFDFTRRTSSATNP